MDVKELIDMGGFVELTGPLLVFLSAADVSDDLAAADKVYPFTLYEGSMLKLALKDDNAIQGAIVHAAPPSNTKYDFGCEPDAYGVIDGLPFLTSAMDLVQAL